MIIYVFNIAVVYCLSVGAASAAQDAKSSGSAHCAPEGAPTPISSDIKSFDPYKQVRKVDETN